MVIKEIEAQAVYQAVWQRQDLHVLQSWAWGQVKHSEGWQILRLGLFPPQGAAAEITQGPLTVLSLQIKKMPVLGSKFAYLPKLADKLWNNTQHLELLRDYLKQHGIGFCILEFDQEFVPDPSVFIRQNRWLKPYNGHIQPQQTNLVPLGRPEEELLMAMEGNYRRNIKKALREGVRITLHQYAAGPQSSLPVHHFYEVMQSIFSSTKYMERDPEYFQTIWNTLGLEGKARIFLAEKENAVVGAYLTVNDNKAAYELFGGVTRSGREVEAGYLIKWEAIKYFNSIGLKFYDHWGVAPKLPDGSYKKQDELYQISKFKEGFGGSYVEFPAAQVLITDPMRFNAFVMGDRLNKAMIRLRKLIK